MKRKAKSVRRSFLKRTLMLLTTIPITHILPAFSKACRTASDATGPFYRRKAPLRTNIALSNSERAEKLIVSGKVFGNNCEQPIASAEVDVWHADPKGNYDNSTQQFKFRGIVKTDSQGNYKFETVMPGFYGSRPRHIHYKVRHKSFKELTTQLYFKGDKYLKSDPTSRNSGGQSRAMEYTKTSDGIYEMTFDIYLA